MDLLVGGVKPIAFSTTSTHINPQNADHNFLVDASGSAVGGPADNAFFVEGSSGKVGIGTGTPAALLEVEQGSVGGQTAVLIDNDDVDQHALLIDAANTTVQVAQIKASNTTSNVLEVTGSSLTTGGLMHLQSDSSDTGNRTLLTVHNDNTAAVGVQMVHFLNDAIGGEGDPNTPGRVISSGNRSGHRAKKLEQRNRQASPTQVQPQPVE